jgi:hypothetical protein
VVEVVVAVKLLRNLRWSMLADGHSQGRLSLLMMMLLGEWGVGMEGVVCSLLVSSTDEEYSDSPHALHMEL